MNKRVRFRWLSITLPLIIFILIMSSLGVTSLRSGANSPIEIEERSPKIRGVHLFRSRGNSSADLEIMAMNGIEWIAIAPYIYQENSRSTNLQVPDRANDRWRRRDSSMMASIETYQSSGFEVVIKPHIWMRNTEVNGMWSEIDFSTEDEWSDWMSKYEKMILYYAAVSEQRGLKLFCIGTELASVVEKKPDFWKELIPKIRDVYSGKLTYAANWYREYESVSFWDKLDYIGVQGYFPLSKTEEPSVSELIKGWKPHLSNLREMSRKYDKPILFTELGYSTTTTSAHQPWEWITRESRRSKTISLTTQANCFEAFFRTFWDQSWFAGALIWEWYGSHERAGGHENMDFTPQNKPAEYVIREWFGRK